MARRLMKVVVFARRVNHPGTKAQPYLEPAGRRAYAALTATYVPWALKQAKKGSDLQESLIRELEKAVGKAAVKMLQVAKDLVPVDNGGLRNSLTVAKRSTLVYSVGTNLSYGLWVETGTRPHPIFPRKASVLRFTVKRPRTS